MQEPGLPRPGHTSAALEGAVCAVCTESTLRERVQRHVRDRTTLVRSVQAPGRENDPLRSSTWTRFPKCLNAERTWNQQLDWRKSRQISRNFGIGKRGQHHVTLPSGQ